MPFWVDELIYSYFAKASDSFDAFDALPVNGQAWTCFALTDMSSDEHTNINAIPSTEFSQWGFRYIS